MSYKNKYKKFLTLENLTKIVIVGIIAINFTVAVIDSGDKYLKFNFRQGVDTLDDNYVNSQYVSKKPKYIIPDETINSYAGWKYVNGESPILIAADTPPLGRYLIGISELLFNNANIVTVVFAVLSLLLMYLVGKQILKSSILALTPPLLFSFEPIFKNQIIYSPLLDIIQLVFLLSAFYFFNRGVNKGKSILYFIMVNIFVGLFISTKFFVTGATIMVALSVVLLLNKNFKDFKKFILTLPISILILLGSYIRVLELNYPLNKFLGIQKYVFLYHKTQLIFPFSIWSLILFNKWFVWYGDKPIISDPQWQITWPVLTIITIVGFILYFFKKIRKSFGFEVLLIWSVFYFLFFCFGQITSRYLIILIPVLYITSIYIIKELFVKYYQEPKYESSN
jgi:hypothetical protein